MASALNSSGVALVSIRRKEQTWVPAERPGCSATTAALSNLPMWSLQQHSKLALCKHVLGSGIQKSFVRVCFASAASPVVSSLEDQGHVDWTTYVVSSQQQTTDDEETSAVVVTTTTTKTRKVRVAKQKRTAKHVERSLEAIGVRNASLAKCVSQGDGMTEQEMLEWMSMLRRLGVAHAEIVSMVGKDASVLRAHIPDVELLFSHLENELNLDRSAIAAMCMLWPSLLHCPVQQVVNVTAYFVSVGVTRSDLTAVLLRRPSILGHSVERIQYSIQCLMEAGVLVDDLVPILKKVPELFADLTQKNLDSKLEFLVRVGLGSGALGKAIARRPNILNYSLDSMRVAFKYLSSLMLTRDVPKLIKRYAEVLVLDPQRKMAPMVDYLISLGVRKEKIGKVILRRPQLLGYTIPGLQPTVQYLIELGVKPEFLGKVISTSPQVLTLNVEEKLKPVVEFFRSMGLNKERDIEMLLVRNAQILCCSIEKNLRPKFIYFKGLGLTEQSIAEMIVLFPSMLGQSIEGSLAPKYNYLINDMNRPVEEIVQFPQYFGYSLEKRIKPRHELLKEKSITTSLASMLACVDNDFRARYLSGQPPSRAPYSKRIK